MAKRDRALVAICGLSALVVTALPTQASAASSGSSRATVPQLVSVSPSSGPQAGGTEVVIHGSGLTGTTGVQFGSRPATRVRRVSDSVVEAVTPPGEGRVRVSVVTAQAASVSDHGNDTFTYGRAVPAVTGLAPGSGPGAGGTEVTISGSGFTAASRVLFGSQPARRFTVTSDRSITAVSPWGSGAVEVSISGPNGRTESSPQDRFDYVPTLPWLDKLSAARGVAGSRLSIFGHGLSSAQQVLFGQSSAFALPVGDTELQVTVPAGNGTVDVVVVGAAGTSRLQRPAGQFTYDLAGPRRASPGRSPSASTPSGDQAAATTPAASSRPASAIAAGQISGTVVDAVTGAGIAGICVEVFRGTTFNNQAGSATTQTGGGYTVSGLSPDDYTVEFFRCGADYITQWYLRQSNQQSANLVRVNPSGTTGGVDASLTHGGHIAGKVTLADGTPLGGVCVDAQDPSTNDFSSTTTAPDGTYGVSGLAGGAYQVSFRGCSAGNFVTQYYYQQPSAQTANAVAVSPGSTHGGVDGVLRPGAAITGTVKDTGGALLFGVCVTGSGPVSASATTASDGTYTLAGLSTGSYTVSFDGNCQGPGANWLTQYYLGQPDFQHANPVSAGEGRTTGGVDASLRHGGLVTGTVKDAATGLGLGSVCVNVSQPSGGGFGFTTSASDGTYSVSGLPTGSYTASFSDCGGRNYLTQYYFGQSSLSSANPVPVNAGQTTSGIDAGMQSGGLITGTVYDNGGHPLQNVCVNASAPSVDNASGSATTDASGNYSIQKLPTAAYSVQFAACFQGGGTPPVNVVTQWYQNQPDQARATLVGVSQGATTNGVDAHMQPGGVITGTVFDNGGHGLGDICAFASSSSQQGTSGQSSSTTGQYSILGLPTGSYTVAFSACSGQNFVTQYYQQTTDPSAATPVSATQGFTTTGVNAVMQPGGVIAGNVKGSGASLSGLTVNVYTALTAPAPSSAKAPRGGSGGGGGGGGFPRSGGCLSAAPCPIATAFTDMSGNYSVNQLPSGNYDVQFVPSSSQNFVTRWYQGQQDQAHANPVSVTQGFTTSGIDAALPVGGQLTGTTYGPSGPSGGGLANVCVTAMVGAGAVGFGFSDSAGHYSVSGLPTGTYTVRFDGCGNNYAPQWYQGQPDQAHANPVSVTQGFTTTGIDAAMQVGGQITGTVRGPGGGSLQSICVTIFSGSGASAVAVAFASTDVAGHYAVIGLPPGSYTVSFDGCGANYVTQWYLGQPDQAHANPVGVTQGFATGGVNATMQTGGRITGTVFSGGATPAAGVCVSAVPRPGTVLDYGFASTDGSGQYEILGLPSGSFSVEFTGGCGGPRVVSRWYQGQTAPSGANPVRVNQGLVTSGVNATTPPTTAPLSFVVGVSPHRGAAGTSVTISGVAFTGASAVYFGATPATAFVVNSDSSITATAPSGSSFVDITVSTPSGSSRVEPSVDWYQLQ